uniref:Myophilin n=1 Tax=Caligus rogercresseyi TaxID=217165 RepID=C1BP38_CALRO|nr:Myophilin [Caligus rogercresseyi]
MAPRKPEEENEILTRIESLIGESISRAEPYEDVLQNGVILCKQMNSISPSSIPKFKEKGPAFLLMENITAFLKAAKTYGVPEEEVFQTPDLFEARNIPQVTLCLYSLGRTTQKHPEYTGAKLGPKMATKNERGFTEDQIKAGRDSQIGLQAGFNKGASQAGHRGMGNTRHM